MFSPLLTIKYLRVSYCFVTILVSGFLRLEDPMKYEIPSASSSIRNTGSFKRAQWYNFVQRLSRTEGDYFYWMWCDNVLWYFAKYINDIPRSCLTYQLIEHPNIYGTRQAADEMIATHLIRWSRQPISSSTKSIDIRYECYGYFVLDQV